MPLPMKRHVFVAATLALCALPSIAMSAQLLSDIFSYPAGNLAGNGGWVVHSAGGKPVQVNAGGVARLEQSPGSGEDLNTHFASQSGSATTYASFDLMVPTGGVIDTTRDASFAHFRTSTSDSGSSFLCRVVVLRPITDTTVPVDTLPGDYSLGVTATILAYGGATPHLPVRRPVNLAFGRVYKVVVSFNASTGTATLWVDPVSEASPSVSSTSASAIGSQLGSFALRQNTQPATSGAYFEFIDQLGVGTTFEDARRKGGPAVPSVSEWGLMVMAMGLLLAGTMFVVGRRRRAVA